MTPSLEFFQDIIYLKNRYYIYSSNFGILTQSPTHPGPPREWLKIKLSSKYQKSLRTAFQGEGIVVNKEELYLAVIQLKKNGAFKQVIQLPKYFQSTIHNFQVFGAEEDCIIAMGPQGHTILARISLRRKKVTKMNFFKISVFSVDGFGREVSEFRLTGDGANTGQNSSQYLIVATKKMQHFEADKLLVYVLKDFSLELITCYKFGLADFRLPSVSLLEVVFLPKTRKFGIYCFSDSPTSELALFEFCPSQGSVQDLRGEIGVIELRVSNPVWLVRVGAETYCSGFNGRLLALKIVINF